MPGAWILRWVASASASATDWGGPVGKPVVHACCHEEQTSARGRKLMPALTTSYERNVTLRPFAGDVAPHWGRRDLRRARSAWCSVSLPGVSSTRGTPCIVGWVSRSPKGSTPM